MFTKTIKTSWQFNTVELARRCLLEQTGDVNLIPSQTQRTPVTRSLEVFSLDPSLAVQMDHAPVSSSEIKLRWEQCLKPGPVGDYLQVVDVDPASDKLYPPVDLNSISCLADNGLSPSLGDPQFHQQMVYAVAMKTIENFERILGRRVLWRERYIDEKGHYVRTHERFVPRLRIYPHALRQENAYYSPGKVALLFGYFNATTNDPREELPGGLVFTCLSHDIIAHETTHAILDGMNRRLLEAVSNVDMLAFHEAFADIVAIFQHFTLPDLLQSQIQSSRGNLSQNTLLAQLATQFARSTNRGNSLRQILGEVDEDGNRSTPDPGKLSTTFEPHARGAILVAAIFDAFLRIYESRVADLRRIATNGTGVLPEGDIHPDLAARFAAEARTAADRVLSICVRAVDYLPPVDITFGDYVRAIITADADLFPDDTRGYRLAFIEAFRARGIYPHDVFTLSEESLCWKEFDYRGWDENIVKLVTPPTNLLRSMAVLFESESSADIADSLDRINRQHEDLEELTIPEEVSASDRWKNVGAQVELMEQKFSEGHNELAVKALLDAIWSKTPADNGDSETPDKLFQTQNPGEIRRSTFYTERIFKKFLHSWLRHAFRAMTFSEKQDPNYLVHYVARILGLDIRRYLRGNVDIESVEIPEEFGERMPPIEVFLVRPTVRVRDDGRSKTELLIGITQKTQISLLDEYGKQMSSQIGLEEKPLSFDHRGGCNLIIDPETGIIKYSIVKNILSKRRIRQQSEFYRNELARHGDRAVVHYGLCKDGRERKRRQEALAVAHSHSDEWEGY